MKPQALLSLAALCVVASGRLIPKAQNQCSDRGSKAEEWCKRHYTELPDKPPEQPQDEPPEQPVTKDKHVACQNKAFNEECLKGLGRELKDTGNKWCDAVKPSAGIPKCYELVEKLLSLHKGC
ncbi:hypothetical protein CDD83_6462 [Cordyceps sp. RAO-2017]|nr:hypothetical protein CDD83_6462 [Cordyceps sp. RAO-2017]